VEYLPPPHEDEPAPKPVARRNTAGGFGALGAGALALLLKFKLVLLLGLKLLAPSWGFLLSLWLYVALFGWRIALVLLLVLLAHELGHYFAFRAYGLPASLPRFVPFLGAFTAGAIPDSLEDDAYIALAGPLTGLGLAAACYAVASTTHDRFWFACADISAFLNLFNMIPMPPFDGGRVINAVWPPLWIGGFLAFIAFALWAHIFVVFIIIIGVLGLLPIFGLWRGQVDPRAATMTLAARLRVSGWYIATLAGLAVVLSQAHSIAMPGTTNGASW
jgi:Zn-dependent protease